MRSIRSLFLFLFVPMCIVHPCFAGSSNSDSLTKLLALRKDTSRIRILNQLSTIYRQSDIDLSEKFARQALKEAGESNDPCLTGHCIITLGNILLNRSKYDSAITTYDQAILYLQQCSDHSGIGDVKNNQSLTYYLRSQYDIALKKALEALTEHERSGNVMGIIASNTNIGNVYYVQKNYDKALSYYFRNLELLRKKNDKYRIGIMLNNIGGVYLEKGDKEHALPYLDSAILIRKESGDRKGLAGSLMNAGILYFELKKFNLARNYLEECIKIKKELGDRFGTANALVNLAEVYSAENDLRTANSLLLNARGIADSLSSFDLKRTVYKSLSDNYANLRDFANAYSVRLELNTVEDSIMSGEKMKSLNEMQERFESEKKENENELLKQEKMISGLKIEEDRKQKMILYAGIGFLLILLITGIWSYRIQLRSRKLLEETSNRIKTQNFTLRELNKKLIESEEQLQELNKTKDKLFSLVAHDISNPVKAVSNFTNAVLSKTPALTQKELLDSFRKLLATTEPLQELIDNLLAWAMVQKNSPVQKPEQLLLRDTIGHVLALFSQIAAEKELSLVNAVSENAVLFVDRTTLQIILRNLISNAVKYSGTNGTVKISSDRKDGAFILIVEDSGTGMSEDRIRDIFYSNNFVESLSGTRNERGTGIGLNLVKEFVTSAGGSIHAQSSVGKGTTIKIHFPL